MKAIILAAGKGNRLGEIGKSTPKCLIKIGKKTIIEHQIEALRANKINDITIVIGYQANKVKDKLKNTDVKFYLNKNYGKTGMLESLYCAKDELDDNIIFLCGDIVLKADLIKPLLEDKNDFCLIVDKQKEIIHGTENVFEDYHEEKMEKGSTKVNIVHGIVKKISKGLTSKEISGEYIGIAKYSKNAIEIIREIIKELISNGEIKKYPSPSYLIRWLIENGKRFHVIYTDDLLYEEIDYLSDLKKAMRKFE